MEEFLERLIFLLKITCIVQLEQLISIKFSQISIATVDFGNSKTNLSQTVLLSFKPLVFGSGFYKLFTVNTIEL